MIKLFRFILYFGILKVGIVFGLVQKLFSYAYFIDFEISKFSFNDFISYNIYGTLKALFIGILFSVFLFYYREFSETYSDAPNHDEKK